jgi:hypothetical protein
VRWAWAWGASGGEGRKAPQNVDGRWRGRCSSAARNAAVEKSPSEPQQRRSFPPNRALPSGRPLHAAHRRKLGALVAEALPLLPRRRDDAEWRRRGRGCSVGRAQGVSGRALNEVKGRRLAVHAHTRRAVS